MEQENETQTAEQELEKYQSEFVELIKGSPDSKKREPNYPVWMNKKQRLLFMHMTFLKYYTAKEENEEAAFFELNRLVMEWIGDIVEHKITMAITKREAEQL